MSGGKYRVLCESRGVVFAVYTFDYKEQAIDKADELLKNGIDCYLE